MELIPVHLFKNISLTGSKAICDPAPLGTDIDFVGLAALPLSTMCSILVKPRHKWEYTGRAGYKNTNTFDTYRKFEYNLIVVADPIYYMQWVVATQLAKKKNLLKKEDRINLFRTVLNERENSS